MARQGCYIHRVHEAILKKIQQALFMKHDETILPLRPGLLHHGFLRQHFPGQSGLCAFSGANAQWQKRIQRARF